MDNKSPFDNNYEEEKELLPLIKLCLHYLRHNWGWFVLSAFVAIVLGFVFLQTRPTVFQRQAVMLIEDAGGGESSLPLQRSRRNSGMNTLLELNGVSVGDNLKNEIFIIGSRRLMLSVVDKLNLTVDYSTDESLHRTPLYQDESPVKAIFAKPTRMKAYSMTLHKTGSQTAHISNFTDSKGNKLPDMNIKLGESVKTAAGPLTIVPTKSWNKWEEEPIYISYMSRENAAHLYLGKMSVGEYDKETSLVVMTCNDAHIKRADDVLTTLYETYKEDVVENKNRVALNTGKFIDERIALIGTELSHVESELAQFKRNNQIIDFTQAAGVILNETSKARDLSIQLETELNVARYLADYVKNQTTPNDLIPAINLAGASWDGQITEYNKLMNERTALAANTSEQNEVVRTLDKQLAAARSAISRSIATHINGLTLQLQQARRSEGTLEGKITGAPDQEKEGISIKRQQSLKEALYTYLLNKREEVALQQAISEANVRLVEGPLGNTIVAPRRVFIMAVCLMLGLLLPAVILWIIHLFDVAVHSRRDIEEATSIPLLGEVPHMDNGNDTALITQLSSDNPVVEAFRIMRFNLSFIQKNPKVFLCTSTTPGQGKSFVARNFAIILSMAKKRIVVIDADIRKRTLSHKFGHRAGLTTYLADSFTSIADIVVTDGIAQGVDFIPAGSIPPNPSELLMSDRMDKLVNELKETYDYVIFDSTPMFAVADASIVSRHVDATLYVMRAGVQEKAFLPELERLFQAGRFKGLVAVLNDISERDSAHTNSYGYGYGYGYGNSNTGRSHKRRRIFSR